MHEILIELSDENYKKIMRYINKVGVVNVNRTFSTFINKALDLYFSEGELPMGFIGDNQEPDK